jgi:hypothetical protein
MARTAVRSPSIEARMEEEEESGSSDDDQGDPRIQRTQNNIVFRHPNGDSVFFAFHRLSPGQEARLRDLIIVSSISCILVVIDALHDRPGTRWTSH